jgi:hypothetical protein
MKLPIPTLLYLCAAGTFGYAGWMVYKLLPDLSEQAATAATTRGQSDGKSRLAAGKGKGPVSADWQYANGAWWAEFQAPNFLGKLPEKPPDPTETVKVEEVKATTTKPLEQIIEIVSLVYDGSAQGRGGNSHVIVRYKLEANVQPPEWYRKEKALDGAAGAPLASGPGDVAASRGGARGGRGNTPQPAAMPTSMVGRDILQTVWVDAGNDERRAPTLWGEYSDIKLVRVAPDAQSAFFVRVPKPPKDGEPAVEPKEEELIKTAAALSQDLLRELRLLQGRAASTSAANDAVTPASTGEWFETEDTVQVAGVRHIGRKDEARFRDPDQLLEKVSFDTYNGGGGHTSTRGIIVRSIDTQLATSYGIAQQDVLLEVNGRPVQTQAQVVNFVKGEYKKGVRTFATKWLSNGQVVDRTYQAPTK